MTLTPAIPTRHTIPMRPGYVFAFLGLAVHPAFLAPVPVFLFLWARQKP